MVQGRALKDTMQLRPNCPRTTHALKVYNGLSSVQIEFSTVSEYLIYLENLVRRGANSKYNFAVYSVEYKSQRNSVQQPLSCSHCQIVVCTQPNLMNFHPLVELVQKKCKTVQKQCRRVES